MKKRVVIVGAGVIGLHCAVRLAKAGAQVIVLEAEAEHPSVHGPTASASAAGMLAAVEAHACAHEMLALDSFDLWRRQQDGAEWADGVRFDGAIVIAESADAATSFLANVKRLGRRAALLSASQFAKRSGLDARIEHALFVEDEGLADPLRVLTGLAMQARALGVVIVFRADVREVTATRATTHDEATYEADAIILAPGAWATEALMNAAPALKHVRPAKGQITAIELPRPLGPNLRAPGFYIAQQREGAVVGATLEWDRHDRRVDKARIGELVDAANALLPGCVKAGVRAWAGIRPMSPDGWPMIGPTGAGIFVAAGHSRNGWLLAPLTAEIMTAYVFGAEIAPEWAALSPERFGTA